MAETSVTDPGDQQASADLARYDLLRKNPAVMEFSLPANTPITENLRVAEPLPSPEGPLNIRLIKSLQLGGDKAIQIWGQREDKGGFNTEAILITRDDFDPKDFTLEGHKANLFTPLVAGAEPALIGRGSEAQAASQPLGFMHGTVSKKHLTVELTSEGLLVMTDLGSSNGTTGLWPVVPSERSAQPSPDHGEQQLAALANAVEQPEQQLPAAEQPHPRYEDRHKPISSDPDLVAFLAPLRAEEDMITARYREARKAIEYEMSVLSYGSPERPQLEAALTTLTRQQVQQSAEVKKRVEAAVKPYLRERLALFERDTAAPYLEEGALSVTNGLITSRSGVRVGHRIQGMSGYIQSDIRTGQVSKPARISNWSGGTGGKTNQLTGTKTTSFEHIVDLAAAMMAGTMENEKDKIILERDPQAEAMLPAALQGLPMYKVREGVHRFTASKLISGVDSIARYDEVFVR